MVIDWRIATLKTQDEIDGEICDLTIDQEKHEDLKNRQI